MSEQQPETSAPPSESPGGPALPPPLDPNRKRPLIANPFFWGAIAGLIMIPALRPFLRRIPEPPPVMMQIPEFELTDQRGKAFGSADLRGKVWVASFIFTRCPSICLGLTKSMRKLQDTLDKLKVDIRLVTFTVDPEFDQPPVLRAYMKKHGADPRRWTFLTSTPPAKILQLIVKGFKTHVGAKQTLAGGALEIAHSGRFAIVDGKGGLRGFYGTDDQGLLEVEHRAVRVMLSEQE